MDDATIERFDRLYRVGSGSLAAMIWLTVTGRVPSPPANESIRPVGKDDDHGTPLRYPE